MTKSTSEMYNSDIERAVTALEKEFGKGNLNRVFYALKNYFDSKDGIPEKFKSKNLVYGNSYQSMTNEESALLLRYLEQTELKTEYIILYLLHVLNVEPFAFLKRKQDAENHIKLSDFFKLGNSWFLSVDKRGGNKTQIKLNSETAEKLSKYIDETKSIRGNGEHIFVNSRGGVMTFPNFWARYNTRVRPIYYNHGIGNKKRIVLTSAKNTKYKTDGMNNQSHLERVI